MNNKIAILGDTHFGFKKASGIFSNYFEDFLLNQFFPYLEENEITQVIQLGDLLDSRKYINAKTLKFVNEKYFKQFEDRKIHLFQMVGNHDVYYKNTNRINWIDNILSSNSYEYVTFCDKAETHEIFGEKFDIIPWINEENEHDIFKFMEGTDSKYLFGHLELSGFELTPGHFAQHGHSTKPFKKYDKVISGHYHIRSKKGNITYAGIPYQLTWSDCDDKKGFWILDTKGNRLSFKENPKKLFKRVEYDEDFIDLKSFDFASLEKSYIKVFVRNKKDDKKYDDFLTRLNSIDLYDLSIITNNDLIDNNIELEEIEIEDTLTILRKFVMKNVNDNINSDNIVRHIEDLYSEGLMLMKDI